MSFNIKQYSVIGVFILFFMSCIKDNQKLKPLFQEEIYTVLINQTNAWNKGDINGFMQGYEKSDSLQFITRKGRTVGWLKVYDSYKKNYPTKKEMGELHFKNMLINPLCDSIVQVYGNWEVKSDTIHSGNFSLIMKLKNNGWRIVIDYTW